MVRIACQTIVFGNPVIKDHLASIAETVKTAVIGCGVISQVYLRNLCNFFKITEVKGDSHDFKRTGIRNPGI
jgi:hypothetical protein